MTNTLRTMMKLPLLALSLLAAALLYGCGGGGGGATPPPPTETTAITATTGIQAQYP